MIKVDFTKLRTYRNGHTRITTSLPNATLGDADSITPDQYRGAMIGFSIRVLMYLLTGKGLDEVVTKIKLITCEDEKSIRVITGNLLKLSKKLGDL